MKESQKVQEARDRVEKIRESLWKIKWWDIVEEVAEWPPPPPEVRDWLRKMLDMTGVDDG